MARHYELVLLLDPEVEDSDRDKLAGEVRGMIEASGTIGHEDSWGLRKLAYEIRRRTEADYRYWRFECEPDLLERLDHHLKIADGALRFRIFQVDPSTPTTPPATTTQPAFAGGERPERRSPRESAPRHE